MLYIEIGVLVMCNFYCNLELFVDMVCIVDYIFGGWFILGIGLGWKQKDYDEYGYWFGIVGSCFDDLVVVLFWIKVWFGKLNLLLIWDILVLIGGGGECKIL